MGLGWPPPTATCSPTTTGRCGLGPGHRHRPPHSYRPHQHGDGVGWILVLSRTGQHHLLAGHGSACRRAAPGTYRPAAGCRSNPSEPASRAMRESESGRIGQSVGQRSIEDRHKRRFALVSIGGQGSRAADLPISGLGMRVRQALSTSVTCIAAPIRTPLNANERMRMRPKMSPRLLPGLGRCGWRKVLGLKRTPTSPDLASGPVVVVRLTSLDLLVCCRLVLLC
jgi:hypothetical protein